MALAMKSLKLIEKELGNWPHTIAYYDSCV